MGRIGSEGFEGGGLRGDKHFPHHDRFADGFATARDAEAEPDAEGREEDGDEHAVELDGVLDDDEAVCGVSEGGDEEAAEEAEDEDVALHDGVVKKYNGDGEEVVSPARKQKGRGVMPWPFRGARLDSRYLRKRGYGKCKDEILGKLSPGCLTGTALPPQSNSLGWVRPLLPIATQKKGTKRARSCFIMGGPLCAPGGNQPLPNPSNGRKILTGNCMSRNNADGTTASYQGKFDSEAFVARLRAERLPGLT